MWIGIVLFIIVFIIGKFFYERHKQAAKIALEGGMRSKYRHLIELLLSGDSMSKIYQETSDSITLGVSKIGGTTLFVLTQTFGNVTVQWKVDSPIFGKHKMEWNFPEYADQEKMVERIINDSGKFQENLLNAITKGKSEADYSEINSQNEAIETLSIRINTTYQMVKQLKIKKENRDLKEDDIFMLAYFMRIQIFDPIETHSIDPTDMIYVPLIFQKPIQVELACETIFKNIIKLALEMNIEYDTKEILERGPFFNSLNQIFKDSVPNRNWDNHSSKNTQNTIEKQNDHCNDFDLGEVVYLYSDDGKVPVAEINLSNKNIIIDKTKGNITIQTQAYVLIYLYSNIHSLTIQMIIREIGSIHLVSKEITDRVIAQNGITNGLQVDAQFGLSKVPKYKILNVLADCFLTASPVKD